MNATHRTTLSAALALGLALLSGCESAPTRSDTADTVNPTGAPTEAGVPATKAGSDWSAPGTTAGSTGMGVTGPNSTSSAAGPGTATGVNRGGSR